MRVGQVVSISFSLSHSRSLANSFSFSLSLSLPFQPFDTLVAVTISAKSPVPYQVSALLAPVSLNCGANDITTVSRY